MFSHKACEMPSDEPGLRLSWDVMDPDHESSSESPFTDPWISLKMFLEETSSFKQQNPGKFCLLVCSLCSFLAVLGHYVPGIVISYVLVLAVFLWPLVSPTDLGPWVEPVLQKLDFGVGEFLQRIKENHEKRTLRSQMDRESPEADLSSLFPKLDSDACKELSVSDTEVTWTDNGTFNLSEGHTPQTENSDDLDRPSDQEEVFSAGLPEFPSVENGMGTNGDEDEDLSIGLPTAAATSRSKPKLGRAALAEEAPPTAALELVQRMAEDAIASAVTAAVQGTLPSPPPSSSSSSSTSSTPTSADALARALAEDSDSEAEDFELLDQSELEQLEGELGLNRAGQVAPAPSSTPPTGFISKLLGRR
ncbi:reticulophagy regulator 1 isoform X2 [Denticeps clupeoides]|uniref:RETREG1-3/ARL6IP-like N-terminal reticulon-homology domain-containing protein n=1 Tax=Denticeps clupeoides TaxID=299321 RepID=A0AAY4B2S8_9TELE|nr:reticulophagy regulator 1 isoform X2 [Denticeps clupeoides]